MASNTFLTSLPIFLLLLTKTLTVESSDQTTPNPFGFIKNLEGCHKGQSTKGLKDLKSYLGKFGYMNQNNTKHYNYDEFDGQLESEIKSYQHQHHLKATGKLDPETVTEMMRPRCGLPDIVNTSRTTREIQQQTRSIHAIAHYRLIPGNPKWTKTQLTYRFNNGVQVSGMDSYRAAVARAFQKWGQVTGLTISEVATRSPADIELGFQRRAHGDGNNFEGPGGVLAHATGPNPTLGRCHFDAEERWSTNPGTTQVDFESVALHEIGHLLGLDHSNDPNAVMFSTFSYGTSTKRDLRTDDVQGIRALYMV